MINPKILKLFDSLVTDYKELSAHPDKKHVDKLKKDLKSFTKELENWDR